MIIAMLVRTLKNTNFISVTCRLKYKRKSTIDRCNLVQRLCGKAVQDSESYRQSHVEAENLSCGSNKYTI